VKPRERREILLSLLRASPREWAVQELSDTLEVSPITIRRDLDKLVKSAVIRRTHGGCIAVVNSTLEAEYHRRATRNFDLKRAIGTRAAREVSPGMSLLIADSTTTYHVATHIGDLGPLTVYTNSIAMVPELSRLPKVRLYVLGGRYHSELLYLGGSLTEHLLESLSFDIVLLGTEAIDEEGRCLVAGQDMARLAEVMLRRGQRKILLADHTKVGARGSVAYGTLADFDLWITTPGIGQRQLRKYREKTSVTQAALPAE